MNVSTKTHVSNNYYYGLRNELSHARRVQGCLGAWPSDRGAPLHLAPKSTVIENTKNHKKNLAKTIENCFWPANMIRIACGAIASSEIIQRWLQEFKNLIFMQGAASLFPPTVVVLLRNCASTLIRILNILISI